MRLLIITLFIPLIVISCSRVNEDELFQAAQTAYQQKKFQEAIQKYEELVDRFPQGKRAEMALLTLATIYNDDLQDYRKAISTYSKLRELFPNGQKAPMALFLIGFIYNNQLQQYDSARVAYEEFLAKYPNHEMTASAKFELDNLGKNPEELIKPEVAVKLQAPTAKPKKK